MLRFSCATSTCNPCVNIKTHRLQIGASNGFSRLPDVEAKMSICLKTNTKAPNLVVFCDDEKFGAFFSGFSFSEK